MELRMLEVLVKENTTLPEGLRVGINVPYFFQLGIIGLYSYTLYFVGRRSTVSPLFDSVIASVNAQAMMNGQTGLSADAELCVPGFSVGQEV